MSISFTIMGLSKLQSNLVKMEKKLIEAEQAALYKKGMLIAGDAAMRTPVDTGRLRSTVYASPPTGFPAEVEVGFGTDYALPVHERVDVYHRVGQPLFLWAAVQLHSSGWEAWMAKQTGRYFALGIGARSIPRMYPTKPPKGK